MAGFDNIYRFELSGSERVRAPIDAPYTAKSSALLSEQSVSYACIYVYNYISCLYGVTTSLTLQVGFADQQFIRPVYKRSYTVPQDPRFREQWFMVSVCILLIKRD